MTRAGAEIHVTNIEYDLFVELLQARGRVLSKRKLLQQVWNFDEYDVNLVEVHISALRHKLEARGPRIIHTFRGVGYVLRADVDP